MSPKRCRILRERSRRKLLAFPGGRPEVAGYLRPDEIEAWVRGGAKLRPETAMWAAAQRRAGSCRPMWVYFQSVPGVTP